MRLSLLAGCLVIFAVTSGQSVPRRDYSVVHGSTAVLVANSTEAVVAADSVSLFNNAGEKGFHYGPPECKIFPLNRDTALATTGVLGRVPSPGFPRSQSDWSISDVLHGIAPSLPSKGDAIDQASKLWAKEMIDRISPMADRLVDSANPAPDYGVSTGLFVALTAQHSVKYKVVDAYLTFKAKKPIDIRVESSGEIRPSDAVHIEPIGGGKESIQAYLIGAAPREEQQEMDRQTLLHPVTPTQMENTAERLINLAIAQSKGHSKGPVAILLINSGGFQWVKPESCVPFAANK